MAVKIRFFGQLRELVGHSEITLDIAELGNMVQIKQVKLYLHAHEPSRYHFLLQGPLMMAVNQSLCDEQQIVNQDDELAFFPPVTGG